MQGIECNKCGSNNYYGFPSKVIKLNQTRLLNQKYLTISMLTYHILSFVFFSNRYSNYNTHTHDRNDTPEQTNQQQQNTFYKNVYAPLVNSSVSGLSMHKNIYIFLHFTSALSPTTTNEYYLDLYSVLSYSATLSKFTYKRIIIYNIIASQKQRKESVKKNDNRPATTINETDSQNCILSIALCFGVIFDI